MKKSGTVLFQIVIVLIGIGTFIFMLWEPHIEGRNVDATVFEIYLKDPFLAYVYIASIAFFTALYKAFKLVGYIRQNKIWTLDSVNALGTIKHCATAIVVFVLGAEVYIFVFQRGKDDIAGGVFIGLLIIVVSGITVTVARMFEKLLQNVVDTKSEIAD